jgi:hypothetical protein
MPPSPKCLNCAKNVFLFRPSVYCEAVRASREKLAHVVLNPVFQIHRKLSGCDATTGEFTGFDGLKT